MNGGTNSVDFTGVTTGQIVAEDSLHDFGFCGIVDFTGVPVGFPVVAGNSNSTVSVVAGAATNAAEAHKGRRNTARYHPVAVRMMYDSLLRQLSINEAKLKFKIQVQTLAEMNARYKKELFEHNRTVLSAVVLSEL